MSKARTLANLISDNAELADGQISVAEVVGAAPLASPTFTGTVTSTGNIALGDDDELVLGSNRMRLYYSASNNYTVLDSNGTSGFVFDGVNNLSVNIGGSLSGAFTANGVSLYSGGTEKLQVYGSGTIALDDIKVNDDVKIGFGQFHTDLELYHDSATTTNKLVGDLTQTGAFTTDKYNNAEALPTVRPSLLLDFANSKTLDPRITFTRGSTATYWDGKTTTKAEENLISNSRYTGGSGWNSGSYTEYQDHATAPDGTTTATKVSPNSSAAGISVSIGTGIGNDGDTITGSIYAKQDSTDYPAISLYFNSANGARATFDITNGTVVGTTNGTGTITASIVSVGNGWYRCICTFSGATTPECTFYVLDAADNNDFSLDNSPDGTKGMLVWGPQFEKRSTATAYTPTTSAPIVKYQPTLQTAASGEARFDHDPVTGESKGLLIEEPRTNLIVCSSPEDTDTFGSNGWQDYYGFRAYRNTAIAPDGTQTAATVRAIVGGATTGASMYVNNPIVISSDATYTYSVYLKKGGEKPIDLVTVSVFGNGNVAGSYQLKVDLSDGTVDTLQSGTAIIENVGNGWYRCSVTQTLSAGE